MAEPADRRHGVLTIAGPVRAELEIKKSRFIAVVDRAASEEQARAVVAAARSVDPGARHYCSAFVVDVGGETDGAGSTDGDEGHRVERSNDDGEPGGTAGMPMLEVLRGNELTNVVAVVTRYFGGTKLGTGGLARAYGGAVSAALGHADVLVRQRRDMLALDLGHTEVGRVESELRARGVVILGTSYGESATLRIAAENTESVVSLVSSLTGGKALPTVVGRMFVEFPV